MSSGVANLYMGLCCLEQFTVCKGVQKKLITKHTTRGPSTIHYAVPTNTKPRTSGGDTFHSSMANPSHVVLTENPMLCPDIVPCASMLPARKFVPPHTCHRQYIQRMPIPTPNVIHLGGMSEFHVIGCKLQTRVLLCIPPSISQAP
jgi:hypothetical protein